MRRSTIRTFVRVLLSLTFVLLPAGLAWAAGAVDTEEKPSTNVAIQADSLVATAADTSSAATLTRKPQRADEQSLVTDFSSLNGKNWMSGISGQRFLHEINIPGTHDSAMWNPYSKYILAKTQYSYAKTHTLSIEEQLQAGIRLFDLRLTNVYPAWYQDEMFSYGLRTIGTQGLYLVHGPYQNLSGDWRYYGDQDEGVLQFDAVMQWYATFLKDNPTEAIIIDVSNEYLSGDADVTIARLREKLDPYYTTINPSTGKPYIYSLNNDRTCTTMPTLAEVRGQIVVISSKSGLGRGFLTESQGGDEGGTSTIGGVTFYKENHYKAPKGDKVKYLNTLLDKSVVDLPKTIGDALDHSALACTTSNRPPIVESDPHQSPKEVSETVNPAMYGKDGSMAKPGKLYGWMYSDFVTNDTAKTFWSTNFPNSPHSTGLEYATVTYKSEGASDKSTVLQSGTTLELGTCMFSRPSSYAFLGWKVGDGDRLYQPGDTVTISQDTSIVAQWTMSWSDLQKLIDESGYGATINLTNDVVATASDTALTIPSGKEVTINFNGYTINRAEKERSTANSVFIVKGGTLTLNGPGTVTGGYANYGGGVKMLPFSELVANNIDITGNQAAVKGGGVYIDRGATFEMQGGTITKNISPEAGGVSVQPKGSLKVSGDVQIINNKAGDDWSSPASNVFLSMDGSATVPVDLKGGITDKARIGISTESTPASGAPVVISSGLGTSELLGMFRSDSKNYSVGEVNTGEGTEAALYAFCKVSFDVSPSENSVESQKVVYGGHATKPKDPLLLGGRFDGWYESSTFEGNPYDFENSIVTSDIVLYAKWIPILRTVSFDYNDGTGRVMEKQVGLGSKVAEPTGDEVPVREGYKFNYWALVYSPFASMPDLKMERQYNFDALILYDITLKAKWSLLRPTVTFDSNGGLAMEAKAVDYGQSVARPADPTKEQSVFGGWYVDEACMLSYDFNTPVKADVTLHAKWIGRAESGSHTVTFDTNGGTAAQAQAVEHGQQVETFEPTRDGYNFEYWYTSSASGNHELISMADGDDLGEGESKYDFNTPVTSDLVLYAKWTPVAHTLTFKPGNGLEDTALSVMHDQLPEKPASDPALASRTFAGWFLDVGTDLTDEQVAEIQDAINAEPVHQKSLWLEGNTLRILYDFETPVQSDLTLYARWVNDVHTVTFNANGGTSAPDQQIIEHGAVASIPTEPEKEHSDFAGWYSDDACTEHYWFSTPVTSDITLHAKWETRVYDVTFVADGGSEVEAQSVAANATATEPDAPTRDGYLFAGWYADRTYAQAFDFATPITDDVLLFSKWDEKPVSHTASFDAAGGTPAPGQQVVNNGGFVQKPDDPNKPNATFAGWYWDVGAISAVVAADIQAHAELAERCWVVGGHLLIEFDFENWPLFDDIELRARWQAEECTVTFMSEEKAVGTQRVRCGEHAERPQPDPVRQGSDFLGWYRCADGTLSDEEVHEIMEGSDYGELYDIEYDGDLNGYVLLYAYDIEEYPVTEDTTLYAIWSNRTYWVTYLDEDGGTWGCDLVLEGDKTERPDAGMDVGLFEGWFTDEGRTVAYDFSTPVTHDLKLYGKRTATKHIVSFDSEGGSTEGLEDQSVAHGGFAVEPAQPTKSGYAFAGWYTNVGAVSSQADLDADCDKLVAAAENDEDRAAIKDYYKKLKSSLWQQGDNLFLRFSFNDAIYLDTKLHARWIKNSTPIAKAEVTGITDKTWTGKPLKQKLAVKRSGKTLKAGTDYTITYKNNKNVGKAKVIITGKGNYTGTITRTFEINPESTSVKQLTGAKNAIMVRWNKQSKKMSKTRITGYQVQVATDKAFTKNKKIATINGFEKAFRSIKKLESNKKYFVRIRTFKTVASVTYCSPWSKAKVVKTL